MTKNLYEMLFDLRLTVGYLGEKNQCGWWESSFLSPSSKTFLVPVFTKTSLLAQYHGVCQAASRVHDEHIGLGLHYHLYRLPESIEQMTTRQVQPDSQEERVAANFPDQAAALAYLEQFGDTTPDKSEGPIAIGDYSESQMEHLLRRAASHYFKAFTEGYTCLPFFRHS